MNIDEKLLEWLLEPEDAGKVWGDFGIKKQPSKWVTLRALRSLRFCPPL
jgi:hypothetical protein